MGLMACQTKSKFAQAYRDGVHKTKYWESRAAFCIPQSRSSQRRGYSLRRWNLIVSVIHYGSPRALVTEPHRYYYEDMLDTIAKLPKLAAIVFRHTYADGVVRADIPHGAGAVTPET